MPIPPTLKPKPLPQQNVPTLNQSNNPIPILPNICQYWKMEHYTGFLLNKKTRVLNHMSRIRQIPTVEGSPGRIVRDDGHVLGLVNDNIASGTKVIFEANDEGSTG